MNDTHNADIAVTEQHGYGVEADCLCGRNFATVRGLREHLTKARLAASRESSCTR